MTDQAPMTTDQTPPNQPPGEEEGLKPCPFCGCAPNSVPQNDDCTIAENLRVPGGPVYYLTIWCEECGAEGGKRPTAAEALAAWNSRAGAGGENTIGAAELDVGRHVYRRIERLMDTAPGTPDGTELQYLAAMVHQVEELGLACTDGEASDVAFPGACALAAPIYIDGAKEDAEVERILALSDDQVLAECRAEGIDPAEVGAQARAAFERAVAQVAADNQSISIEALVEGAQPALRAQPLPAERGKDEQEVSDAKLATALVWLEQRAKEVERIFGCSTARTILASHAAQAERIRELEGALTDDLVMTGCRDRAELIDMATVGKSLLERIAEHTKDGPLKGWAPADDPAEIVCDALNRLGDAEKARDDLLARELSIDGHMTALQEKVAAITAERDALRAALEPFAKAAQQYNEINYVLTHNPDPPAHGKGLIRVSTLRNAAAALAALTQPDRSAS